MFDRMFCTDERRWYAVPLRGALGAVFTLHGMRALAMGGETWAVSLVALGLSVLAGFLTRPVAMLMLIIGAVGLTRFPGLEAAPLPDFDRALMVMGAAGALLVIGGGRISVDSMIQERLIYCQLSTESGEGGSA